MIQGQTQLIEQYTDLEFDRWSKTAGTQDESLDLKY